MRVKIMIHRLFIFIIVFIICNFPSRASAISLHLADADVRYILTVLASSDNINLIMDDNVSGSVSVNIDDVLPIDAIKMIGKIKGLAFAEDKNILFIGSPKNIRSNYGQLHIFKVQYCDLNTLANAIRLSFNTQPPSANNKKENAAETDQGEKNILTDQENNTLLFYGTSNEAEKISNFIQNFDIPSKQVMLEAKVIAIQKDASEKLGIEWNWSQLPQYPDYEKSYETIKSTVKNDDGSYAAVSENIPVTKINRKAAGFDNIPGIIQFGKGPEGIPFEFYYGATLNALITNGKANVLAKPNIMTLNNHKAIIRIGGSVPVPKTSVTDSTTTTAYEYHDTGIILQYTPLINDNGDITADVHTEVSSPLYVEDLKAYRFQTRSADTVVRLKDGETMVIGGLIGSEESKSMSKIPFLGDLPILGNFFRSIKKNKTDSEIIIFLTAHVTEN